MLITHELKKLRKDARLTQSEAARLIHRKLRMYQYYESGKKEIPALLLAEFKRQIKKGEDDE